LRKAKLAVEDSRLPASITEQLPKLKCAKDEVTDEIFRGIRLHFHKLISGIQARDLGKAQLGLAHAFSRNKVAHDVNRQDKPII
jgi:nucleolar protein 56